MDPNRYPESVQNLWTKWFFCRRASFLGSWYVLASISNHFGPLLVTLGYLSGAISWHLRLALAWVGIISQPFSPNFVRPGSGHEFTRAFRHCLLVFQRTSSYFRTAPWYSMDSFSLCSSLNTAWIWAWFFQQSFFKFHRPSVYSLKAPWYAIALPHSQQRITNNQQPITNTKQPTTNKQ